MTETYANSLNETQRLNIKAEQQRLECDRQNVKRIQQNAEQANPVWSALAGVISEHDAQEAVAPRVRNYEAMIVSKDLKKVQVAIEMDGRIVVRNYGHGELPSERLGQPIELTITVALPKADQVNPRLAALLSNGCNSDLPSANDKLALSLDEMERNKAELQMLREQARAEAAKWPVPPAGLPGLRQRLPD